MLTHQQSVYPDDQPDYREFNSDCLVTKTPYLNLGDPEAKRREILAYFHKTFTLYESIFDCLAGDAAFYQQANPLRHPLIFYYGHTAVFYINKLNVAGLINQRVDAHLESMLAIGVDEMSWDDMNTDHYDWPTPGEVKAYRERTREIVDHFIQTRDVQLPIDWENPLWIIVMGIEHERIHLETTSVLIRELPLSAVRPHPVWGKLCQDRGTFEQTPNNALLPVAGGAVTLGKDRSDPLYGWDNEYGEAHIDVADFAASRLLVSNGEFLEFVTAGGYQQAEFWSDEGWRWVQFRQARHPVYWVKSGDSYRYRAMLAVIDMPWDWPVDVNYLEASAFCAWYSKAKGRTVRLPSEAEWYRLRALVDVDQPDWQQAPGNINLEYHCSACPVNHHRFAQGFYDIIGNVWQWTQTPIDALPGFEVHPAYDDFSTPTFDGKHNIFKGGCWISTGNYALKQSRYAFRRHFFQHAGFRYVAGEKPAELAMNLYETSDIIAQYIEFHYGDSYFDVPNYPVACARACLRLFEGREAGRALDLGCATGRAAFELATRFEKVDAIDFSVNLIAVPTNLQNTGLQRYVIPDEGELVQYKEIKLEHFPEYQAVQDRITFLQGDACNLAEKFSDYDLIFAGNLLDRLYDPGQFLSAIQSRIRPGGFLVLTSPYTWLTEFTPRDKWLGGFKAATGENYSTLEGLKEALSPEFRLLEEPRDIRFVIRETARKFQHTVAQLTLWQKRDRT